VQACGFVFAFSDEAEVFRPCGGVEDPFGVHAEGFERAFEVFVSARIGHQVTCVQLVAVVVTWRLTYEQPVKSRGQDSCTI